MIKYLIIDDEYIAHDIIQKYCEMLPHMKLAKNCYDALEANAFLQEDTVDLIFLDLNMPKLKGFSFLRTLANPPKVIVTTAYKEFALEGFELNVVDYLLKPFSFERFLAAVNKISLAEKESNSKEIVKERPRTVFLKSNKQHFQIPVDSIQFLEAAGNYTKVNLEEKTITVRGKISDLLDIIQSSELIQVHKSFAVNMSLIERMEGNRIFLGENQIPIGKLFKMSVLKKLNIQGS